jgi:hypothetical protein
MCVLIVDNYSCSKKVIIRYIGKCEKNTPFEDISSFSGTIVACPSSRQNSKVLSGNNVTI